MFEFDIKHDGWKTKDRQMEQPGFFSLIIMVNYFSSLTSIWGYQGNFFKYTTILPAASSQCSIL